MLGIQLILSLNLFPQGQEALLPTWRDTDQWSSIYYLNTWISTQVCRQGVPYFCQSLPLPQQKQRENKKKCHGMDMSALLLCCIEYRIGFHSIQSQTALTAYTLQKFSQVFLLPTVVLIFLSYYH